MLSQLLGVAFMFDRFTAAGQQRAVTVGHDAGNILFQQTDAVMSGNLAGRRYFPAVLLPVKNAQRRNIFRTAFADGLRQTGGAVDTAAQ